MEIRPITVTANWDSEAKVWVASSDDVPGLITEAETVETLVEKLSVMIPELLEANGADEEMLHVPVELITHQSISLSHRE